MLVVGLRNNQKIIEKAIIHLPDGRKIKIVLIKTKAKEAHIGFECDRDILIDREKIFKDEMKV